MLFLRMTNDHLHHNPIFAKWLTEDSKKLDVKELDNLASLFYHCVVLHHSGHSNLLPYTNG